MKKELASIEKGNGECGRVSLTQTNERINSIAFSLILADTVFKVTRLVIYTFSK